jgi:hypothetical protein
MPSPITMLERFTGVAKKRLITSVWRKLRKTKAVPKRRCLIRKNPIDPVK